MYNRATFSLHVSILFKYSGIDRGTKVMIKVRILEIFMQNCVIGDEKKNEKWNFLTFFLHYGGLMFSKNLKIIIKVLFITRFKEM